MDRELEFGKDRGAPLLDEHSSSKFSTVKSNHSNQSEYSAMLSPKRLNDNMHVIYDSEVED